MNIIFENVVDPALHPPIEAITFNFEFFDFKATKAFKVDASLKVWIDPPDCGNRNEYTMWVHWLTGILLGVNLPFPDWPVAQLW